MASSLYSSEASYSITYVSCWENVVAKHFLITTDNYITLMKGFRRSCLFASLTFLIFNFMNYFLCVETDIIIDRK